MALAAVGVRLRAQGDTGKASAPNETAPLTDTARRTEGHDEGGVLRLDGGASSGAAAR
jgi:hypothetical protein